MAYNNKNNKRAAVDATPKKNDQAASGVDDKMPMTQKGLWMLLAGLVVMISGYILMTGGGSSDPAVFSWDIFDFRRLVAAPIVIIAGIVIEIIAIMGTFVKKEKK